MQERLQRELNELVVESSVGGGMVTVKMSGHKQLVGCKIDPEAMDKDDPSMLEDLIVAAVNEAGRKIEETMQGKMGSHGVEHARPLLSSRPRRCPTLWPGSSASCPGFRASVPRPRPASPTTSSRCRPRRPRRWPQAIVEVKEKLFHCSVCNAITAVDPCRYCADERRDRARICVVEEPFNLEPIERTGEYHGLYHVLLGALSPHRGIGPDRLAIPGLLDAAGGDRGGDPRHQPQRRGGGDRPLSRPAAQAARGAGHPPGLRHAGRRRHRVHRRGDAGPLARRPARDVSLRRPPPRDRRPAARAALPRAVGAPCGRARGARGQHARPAASPSILWEEARGANVRDVDGNLYIDLTSGFGVAAVGHRHPRVVEAVREQAGRLLHGLGDVMAHPLRVELARRLVRDRAGRRAAGLLRDLRRRGGRDRPEDRPGRHRPAGHPRLRALLPRHDARRARRHLAGGVPRALRRPPPRARPAAPLRRRSWRGWRRSWRQATSAP